MFYNNSSGTIWKGTEAALSLSVVLQPDGVTQTVTLPRGFETLVGVYDGTGLLGIRNEWFSYLKMAPNTPKYGRKLDDLGNNFCGVTDIPSTGMKLKVTVPSSAGGAIVISGSDINGVSVSETLTFSASGAPVTLTTTTVFGSIVEVVKFVTPTNVTAYLTDGTINTFFSIWQAGETFPQYRRYRLNSKENDSAVSAICKREFFPLVSDNDPCDINNVLAIENGLRAYRYEQNADYVHAQESIQNAIGYLNGELQRFQGETDAGSVSFLKPVNAGSMRNLY